MVLVSLLLFILAIFGLAKMNFNASVLEDLRPGNPVYDGMHYVEKKLGGTLPLEVVIDSKEEMSVLEPVFLNKINKFNEFILQIPQVSASISSMVAIISQ